MSTLNLLAAIDMLMALFDRGKVVSDLIKKAREENRDVSDEELDALSDGTDQAIADARAAANRIPDGGG